MVFDTFLYWREPPELLDLRFATLAPVVDRFVVVEALVDHQGKSKPLCFEHDRFASYPITHVVADLPPDCTPGQREGWSRDAAMQGLQDADADDLVLVSDCDEIWDPQVLDIARAYDGVTVLRGSSYVWFLNLETPWLPDLSCAVRRHWLDELHVYEVMARPHGEGRVPVQYACGAWHFSCLGGPELTSEKIRSYGHADDLRRFADPEHLRRCYAERRFWIPGWNWKTRVVPVDSRFPEPLQRDPARWQHMILDWRGQAPAG